MRSVLMVCGLAWMAAQTSSGQTDSVLWRYVHPRAQAVAGLEWGRVLASPWGAELRKQLEESDFATSEGLSLLSDIDRVLLSSPGPGSARAPGESRVVVAVEGRFELDRVRESVRGRDVATHTYRNVEIWTPKRPGGERMALGFVNSRVLLFGDLECLRTVIDGGARPPAPLVSRAAELARGNELWMVAAGLPADFAAKPPLELDFLRDIKTLEAAVSGQSGLRVLVTLITGSARSAEGMASAIRALVQLAALKGAGNPALEMALRGLRIDAGSNSVRLALQLDRQEVERAAVSFREKAVALRASVSGAAPAPAVQRPEPVQPRSIFVHGVEGGTKQIPYGR